jgi:hypothetical protein
MKIYENTKIEIWRIIDDFPDYQISNFGRVKSLKFGKEKIKKLLIDHKGYLYTKLWTNGKNKNKKVHILIYESFNNYKLKSNECIHHIDFNTENNSIDNLKLMTLYDHKCLHRTGINNPIFGKNHTYKAKIKMSQNSRTHKLEEWKVKAIHQISNSPIIKQLKITQEEIGKVFEINERTVSAIKNKKIWNHVLENLS